MEVHMQLMHEGSDNARVTVYANRDDAGVQCFTLDSYVYKTTTGAQGPFGEVGESVRAHPLNINRYFSLRAAMADADRVLAGLVTESHQLTGEAL